MKWTSEDIKKIEKLIEIKNKGFYANGKEVTDVYNRVLEKNVGVTNCGSCLKGRISELEHALISFKKQMELSGFTDANAFINEIDAITDEIMPNSHNHSAVDNDKVGQNKSIVESVIADVAKMAEKDNAVVESKKTRKAKK